MPNPLKTGDRVTYRGAVYYARLNGNSIRLYHTAAMRGRPAHTPQTTSVTALQPPPVAKPLLKPKLVAEQPTYLYVSRDVDLPHTVRRVKIGITRSLCQRNRPYRTLVPGSYFIITVALPTRQTALALETRMKAAFTAFRIDMAEVYEIRPHEVERELRRYEYFQCDDGHYRRAFG